MVFQGKRIAVIGMGKTGVAVAGFLGNRGASVVVADEKPVDQWATNNAAIARQSWLSLGPYSPDVLKDVDAVVPSPGIAPRSDILLAARARHLPVLSEIELAYRFIRVPIIAVTGTNGKTTTTTLLGELLRRSGKKVFVGGNIGTPLIDYAGRPQTDDLIVAEISRFQLQWIETFRPHAAMLLNITCDHVDYHGSFEEYRRVKCRIFENQQESDLAILNADDDTQRHLPPRLRARVVSFSSLKKLDSGIFLDDQAIVYRPSGGSEERYPLEMIKLPGRHNVENIMAAVVAARFCGCSPQHIIETVSDFKGLPHRIEFAGEKNAVKFYDDSKGTNVDAVVRALETFNNPVILLLGGRDKDGNFEVLKPLLGRKAKQVVLFGEARERIEGQIGRDVPVVKEETLKAATLRAYREAQPGDVVLLSPGCASFDEFRDYKERGDRFKEVVEGL
jgi:UDP-N-acetylmuramoylalanine--D-glutamate ligase